MNIKKAFGIPLICILSAVASAAVYYCLYLTLALSPVGGLFGIFPPLHLRRAAYQKIINEINAGTLVPDESGQLNLPERYSSLTPRNKIYVKQKEDLTLVLFPVFCGHGKDLQGYLYCSRVLTDDDFYTMNWGKDGIHTHIDVTNNAEMLSVWGGCGHWLKVGRRLD